MQVKLQTSQFGVLKYMGDMLNRDPSLRCPTSAQCIERVKTGSFVFVTVCLQLFKVRTIAQLVIFLVEP